jgi:nucleoside-diphosphate-sugar epimerase
MRILLTGNRGRIGPAIERALAGAGHEVRGFDLADGCDVLDAASVSEAAAGREAIVHVAGLAGDRGRAAADVMAVNLIGTSNVLLAAEARGGPRVIHMSSGRALGILERDPDYLPLDDDHRGLPSAPYALSKWLSEEMCEAFTRRTGVQTICLRPVQVFDDADYERALRQHPGDRPSGRWWHLGVHIHVQDVASAVAAAVECVGPPHIRLLLCAADIADRRPTLELVAKHTPHVPWRGGAEFQDDPHRSLIDIRRAEAILRWRPTREWPGRESLASGRRPA